MLRFESATHSYFWNEKPVPGVSEILKFVGLVDDRFFTEKRAQLGTDVHLACQSFDEGMDITYEDKVLNGYLKAWTKFREDTKFRPSVIEKPFYSPMGYAGTPDRIGHIPGNRMILVDIKSGEAWPVQRLQIGGAYKILATHNDFMVDECWAVHLKKTGTYSIEKHNNPLIMNEWTSVMAVFKLKMEMNRYAL